jgi:signal transduction histidine kinase
VRYITVERESLEGRERQLARERASRAKAEVARAESDAARGIAEAASRSKGEFLAIMSHELRTPLTSIAGYTELLEMGLRGPVTPQQREDLHRIHQSEQHLLRLIDEVLDYARIETGRMQFHPSDVRVAGAVASAEPLIAPQMQAKGLQFSTIACDPRVFVRADPERLQQILLNLLSNAVKFTEAGEGEPGRIEVECTEAGERALVKVTDTGVGIPADKLESIFEPFVQVDTRLTRVHRGTGLGLAISRDLARGMGGELWAESVLGRGSTFTLSLPLAHGPAEREGSDEG